MKKILLSMLTVMTAFMTAGAQTTELSALTDAVYVEPLEASAGSQQTLSVCMKNSVEVQTIQFDLYLPEGLTIVPNEDEELMTASKARINKFNYFGSSIQSDGALRLLAQVTTTNIAVGDGEIATVMVSVPADMLLGDYPITIKNILLVTKDNVSKAVDEVTTKITVVEPQDSRVVLDETSTTAPEASNGAVDVLVKRTIKANEWSTICLPFSMTAAQVMEAFGSNVQIGDFKGCEATFDSNEDVTAINVMFDEASAIEGNHPYVIKVSSPVSEFTVDGVHIAPSEEVSLDMDESSYKRNGKTYYEYNSFIGTYVADTEVPNECLFIYDSQFWYSKGLTKMKAFRGYFSFYYLLTDAVANSRMNIVYHDKTTGIRDNNREAITNDRYYDLQGRSIGTPAKKGLYINNGKKVVVK